MLSIIFYMVGVACIPPVTTSEVSTTYVLRNGVGHIRWKIDINYTADSYVDVFNPMNKTMFHCFGADPEYIANDFEEKIQYLGDYNNGTIAFSVFNATEEDAGEYRSVIDLSGEVVGRQLLVVFAPFQKPILLVTRNANELDNSSLTLTCQIETSGTPPGHSIPVSYTWRRNGAIVENSTKYVARNFELRISYLQRSDLTDTFTCLAFNDYDAMSPESTALEMSKYSMYIESCEVSCINGNCQNDGGESRCVCKQGWTGSNCSTEIDECSSSPCYKGLCFDKHAEYLCVCAHGWTGKQCEIAVDQCSSEPCVNGKRLVKLNSSIGYYCICKEGWSGTNSNSGALGNLTSSTVLIASVAGSGCIIIACFILALGILYRKYKARLYTSRSTNCEELVYHGVNRALSGDYWTIEDEQLYDIRRRVKSDASVEAGNHLPSDDSNIESPCFHTEKDLESVKNGMKTDSDGYLKPSDRGLERETAQGSSTTAPSLKDSNGL